MRIYPYLAAQNRAPTSLSIIRPERNPVYLIRRVRNIVENQWLGRKKCTIRDPYSGYPVAELRLPKTSVDE